MGMPRGARDLYRQWLIEVVRSHAAIPSSVVSDDTAPTEAYTLSLHDALPICRQHGLYAAFFVSLWSSMLFGPIDAPQAQDRKSTRLNSSHVSISYAAFCLKKKNTRRPRRRPRPTPAVLARHRSAPPRHRPPAP